MLAFKSPLGEVPNQQMAFRQAVREKVDLRYTSIFTRKGNQFSLRIQYFLVVCLGPAGSVLSFPSSEEECNNFSLSVGADALPSVYLGLDCVFGKMAFFGPGPESFPR